MSVRFTPAICLTALLAAFALAADKPSQVKTKVLYGTAAEEQQRTGIERWIIQAVEKNGSPSARPHGIWIDLTGEYQRLYTSEQGGFIIDGKATEQDGKYEVKIDACAGVPLDQRVTLKPGERKVIKLTDNPAPNNVFVAMEAPLTKKALKRAELMKGNAQTFRLELDYNGNQDKPFYGLIVSVPPVANFRNRPFQRIMFVKEHEASRIMDHLARDGFLDNAVDLRANIKIPPPKLPGYTIKASAGDTTIYEDLGWGLPMVHRLDALRNAIPDNGKKEMNLLLGRLSGLRKQWEAEKPPFAAVVGRKDSRVRFSVEGGTTIVDITSKFGIDEATIQRESPKWPKSMLVRLHLSGLELFNVGNGEISVDWSIDSTGGKASRVYLRNGGEETRLDTNSPYHSPVRVVGGNGKVPLKGGYFEVPLPAKLFERNPDEIRLEWIDFYRN